MASRTFTGIIESRADSLNIPILKFSYSTTSVDRASPLGWTHLSSSGDLAVVFDHILPHETSSSFSQGDQRLRVLRGGDVLEQLNLNSLAREAAAAGASHSLMQTAKSPVAIIVKSPCLAVRYPMRNDQTRRFQIKFLSDADYARAVSILSQLGCPITHSAAVLPHQASSNRPFSSSSQTPSLLQVGKGEHTKSPAVLSRPTADQHLVRPWSSSLTEPSTSGSCISSFNNSTNASSYEEGSGRLHTSALSIPQTGTLGITTASSPNLATEGPSTIFFHPAHRPLSPLSSNSAGPRQTSDWPSKVRPAIAPALPDVESLNQILPPKRELPFAKPGRNPSSKQPSHCRPSSGKQASKAAQSRGSSSSIFISQTQASASNAANGNPPSVTNQGDGEATITNEAGNGTCANPNPPFRRPLPQESLRANTHTVGSKSIGTTVTEPNTLFANSVSISYPNDRNNASNTETPAAPAIPANTQTPAEKTVGRGLIPLTSRDNIGEVSTSDLSAYLSTPNSERTALVESWVCSQLENDAFLALCQDVEGVWRRIAFGY
ncbi:hypothetical protein GX51_07754 [Blastomyces parvus]|uniref:Uncharacterized protein n=1 Tax=Blastomyces parvus TaxID=2060905 RepID=A0A2B7WIX8_9EURO|nr:hypothetical protein GX51_07754 [Blastomyces parvus]